ncbi:MAG: glycosyltransferase family 4 protein [Saprospiraceae bacterium]
MHLSLTFVIPNVHAFQSGGNIYNKDLIAGLRKTGCSIKVLDLTTFQQQEIEKLKGHYFFDTLYFTQLASIFTKKNKHAQFWLIVHHLESLYPPKGWTAQQYFLQKEKSFLAQFDGFLTSSQFTADYLTANHLTPPKIIILPAIDYFPSNHLIKKTTPIKALMVANLVERKGILPFLERLLDSPLINHSNQLQIQLIGTAAIEKEYAQECLALLKKNEALRQIVHYQGQLSSAQLHSYYQASNLFISTAFMETYGMALQEARAFHLPILGIDGGNVKHHIIEGKTGYLFNDANALINQLERIVYSPNLLAALQRNIQDETPNFYTWEQAGIQLIQQI